MDQTQISSTVIPPSSVDAIFTEPSNHVAPAASIADPNVPLTANHPPYAEMIYAAISALKEKNGSSKRAIAKYIEKFYSHLPPTHSALLTHHLKRLKNNGLLVMVKKSYKLPRSDPPPPHAPTVQRGRGRPPKPKPESEAQPQFKDPQSQPQPQPPPVVQTQGQAVPVPFPGMNAQQSTDPVYVSVGVDDGVGSGQKSETGRPRKVATVEVTSQGGPLVRRGRGRPPGSKRGPGRPRLKRPGRPPKPKSVSTISNGLKRRPGRPPKVQPIPFALSVTAAAPTIYVPTNAPPPPPLTGAVPPNGPPLTAGVQNLTTVPNVPRPRGRPRKNATAMPELAAGAASEVATKAVVGSGRQRGRRPKVPGIMKAKNPTGRPVGRPRKASTASDSQSVLDENLRKKLEYFQSKVKEAVGMLKPEISENAISAVAAIKELEALATMDLGVPLRDETHMQEQPQPQLADPQPPPVQPPPPPQQFPQHELPFYLHPQPLQQLHQQPFQLPHEPLFHPQQHVQR